MVGNLLPDNSGNILVEFDYNNIIVVDPNKTIDAQGNIQERLVDHENLVMFVNLEAEVLPRTKLAVGGSPQNEARTVSISKINFLAPNKDQYLTTSYYDELTGRNTTQGNGANQKTEVLQNAPNNKQAYVKAGVISNGVDGAVDNGLLGITSINVRVSTSFIPSVTIELEDVQGKALFSLGDNSPYAAFFNLPYPPFYLTMKGYYGQAIRYQLNLKKFNAKFNSFSGNYLVSLELEGYKFNILNEVQMGHLLAAPHMYSTTFQLSQAETNAKNLSKSIQSSKEPTANATNSNQVSLSSVTTEKGYEKIAEVYSNYKSKGLLPYDFPEITLYQLIDKIATFETNIMNQYTKADVQPLTDCRSYKDVLKKYYETVYQSNDSWFSKWMDPQPVVLKDGVKIYIFKQGFTVNQQTEGIQELQKLITDYNKQLSDNATLGNGGKYPVDNPIKLTGIVRDDIDKFQVNPIATLQENGIFVESDKAPEITKFFNSKANLFKFFLVKDSNTEGIKLQQSSVFNFQFFIDSIKSMEANANKKQSDLETKITAELAKKLEDDKIGLGFKPSVRNVCAIIMASAEGFIRLLDETHTNAWNLRNDPIRKSAILKNESSATSSDAKQYMSITNEGSSLKSSEIPIYPWPQFFVETTEDVKGKFQLKYIADPSVVDLTKGNRYDKWPEVQFVEEYLKGLTQKYDPPVSQPPLDKSSLTNLLNINAVEFPQENLAYRNKDELKFFYEIYERQFLTAFYTGLGRIKTSSGNGPVNTLINIVSDYESQNIFTSLEGSSPYLTFKLKNYDITANNYVRTLYEFSNQGTGRSYQDFIRDFFVTPYIRTLLDKSFSILSIEDLGAEPQNQLAELAPKLESVIQSASDEPTVIDTYPFTNDKWCAENLTSNNTNLGYKRYNVAKVLKVYSARDVFANFDNISSTTVNRPVTNFYYLNPTNPLQTMSSVGNSYIFYKAQSPKTLLPTQGFMYTDVPAVDAAGFKQLPTETTTSILNTPYFINSILKGVDNWRRGNNTPYKTSAYLFLNSLPLISLKEKLKSKTNEATQGDISQVTNSSLDDLNYFFATLKKFGAIHKLPYAWILKMGSVWHRYKTYKQTNVDILTDVWQNYDFINGYDPIGKNLSKQYKYTQNGKENVIQLQNVSSDINNVQVGFYPKTINDFNVFYNGYDLFSGYTNEELQSVVDRGLKIYNFPDSNISNVTAGTTTFNVKTWSVLLPANIETSATTSDCKPDEISYLESSFIVPSFGGGINESQDALVTNGVLTKGYTFNGNPAVFNGSVRLFWVASNYGYFDSTKIVKPSPYSYMNKVEIDPSNMSPFRLLGTEDYSKIDEMFSVFEKRILDSFEEEFLSFSKAISNIDEGVPTKTTYDQNNGTINAEFRNFQLLFKNLMRVPANSGKDLDELYFKNSIDEQFSSISNQIKSFMSYDVLFRYGNPSNYNKRIFASFLSYQGTQVVTDPIQFEPYVPFTLPSRYGGITVETSRQRYPKEWLELELQVGFSTIPELDYKNTGSYITDFFVDNNIQFTVDNITLLSPLIKMYATQKLSNSVTPAGFRANIQSYLTDCEGLQNLVLNDVMVKIRAKLPNQSQVPETAKQTVVDGDQSKVSIYEAFKALNDKWIAGGDYETKTLFEDILFLDRASRNIGDVLLVDIFELKNVLNKSSLNMNMSVYTFLAGILINNKFTIMNLPAYVNFYNVQDVDGVNVSKPEGSLDFANNLWGTFLNVDYRAASPKMVCFFTGKPSNYLALPDNNYYRFRDDAFDLRRASENPLIENQQGKKDWALSNRCVGFNVDIGIRNQNIFYSFQVGQDSGKATAESIQTQLNMINNVGGTNTATQNVGLYNYYTQRTYPCTVVSLGNALIQPTMYFNLRHVPMFYGPYMIQEVTHTITPGSFQTQFTGIRQGIFDLPQIDKYLQSINQNLLTKLEEFVRNKKEDSTTASITNQGKSAEKQTGSENTKQPENACANKIDPVYEKEKFEVVTNVETSITQQEMIETINKILLQRNENENDPLMQYIVYSLCYITTFNNSKNKFVGYGNNYSMDIKLLWNFSPTYQKYFNKKYNCVSNSKTPKSVNAIANFDTLDKFIEFMYDRLRPNLKRIIQGGLWQYYYCNFPNNSTSEEDFQKNKTTDQNMKDAFKNLKEGLDSLQRLKSNTSYNIKDLDVLLLLNGTTTNSQKAKTPEKENNLNTTTSQPTITCAPPTIISITPLTATTSGTMPVITISGTSLFGKTVVTLNGQRTTITSNKENVLTVVPTNKTSGKIKVITDGGSIESTQEFIFINNSTPDAQTPPPPDTVDNDKKIIENAKKGGVDLFINYVQGTSKLEGRITFYDGVLSKDYPATIFLVTAQGAETKIADFTIVRALPPKDRSGGNFVTTSGGWVDNITTAAELSNNQVVYFDVYIPAFSTRITFVRKVLGFDCPEYDYVYGDVLTFPSYDRIMKNPCCECYPDGTEGNTIIINGVTCNPTGAGC
jgi:hypothetical protein